MPTYIPPSRNRAEQWQFDNTRPANQGGPEGTFALGLAVGSQGQIHSSMVRFLVHFTPGPLFPTSQMDKSTYRLDDGTYYYTAWVSRADLRRDLLVPSPRSVERLAETYIGLPARSIAHVLDVTLANS